MQGRPVHNRKRYSENNLQQEVLDVKEHRMLLEEAAREFHKPKSTLIEVSKRKMSERSGRPTVLRKIKEKYLFGGPFLVLICTFFSKFLGPEAFRGPSCFFKTLNVFDITPLAP